MSGKISWGKTKDGTIEFISLTQGYLDEAHKLAREAFYPHESACKAIGVAKDPGAFVDLEKLTLGAAQDGVSIIAVDTTNDKVVGAAFNKIQTTNSNSETSFEYYLKTFKNPAAKAVVQFMLDVDESFDLFAHAKIDCLLEIMFLMVSPEYRGKEIAVKLCEASIEAAKMLYNRQNIKTSLDGKQLSLEPVPKAVAALFTSPISQRIGRKLNMHLAGKVGYDKFSFNGVSYTDILGEGTYVTFEYIKFD